MTCQLKTQSANILYFGPAFSDDHGHINWGIIGVTYFSQFTILLKRHYIVKVRAKIIWKPFSKINPWNGIILFPPKVS